MTSTRSALSALALGAGTMYFLDPERGRRRRARVRDRFAHTLNASEDLLDKTRRDAGHRVQGVLAELGAEARYRLMGEGPASDTVLGERVRARIGRVVTHPSAIEVTAQGGHVTLSGPVLSHEVDRLLAAIRRVRGVQEVENRLEAHKQPENVPGLQGAGRARTQRPDPLQRTWSPTTRTLAAVSGGAMTIYGLERGGMGGLASGIAGATLLARGVTNMELARLLGFQGRRAVDVHRTIAINAPVDEVFEFWSHFENFSKFMSHVLEVRDLGAGRSHWTVTGPAGTEVRWQAVITKVVPNETLAWKSVEEPLVQHAGIIQFRENADHTTQVDIRMSYNPPAGVLGHTVASFFGSDPNSVMDDDLVRLKSLLEEGKATAHGHEVMLRDLSAEHTGETEGSLTTSAPPTQA